MGLKSLDILTTLLLNLIQYSWSEHILSCNASIWATCPERQSCNATTSKCDCLRGYVRVGDDCETPGEDFTSNSGATVITVIIFTLALLIAGAVLVIKKYNLIEYLNQKIEAARRNHDIMYEDVMIGTDDPPLSP